MLLSTTSYSMLVKSFKSKELYATSWDRAPSSNPKLYKKIMDLYDGDFL